MAPPNFSELEYWDKRFSSTSTPFDWLVPATFLDSLILSSVRSKSNSNSKGRGRCKILHIGCGSSELSHRLGELVKVKQDVWNTDYSSVAIELGRAAEEERAGRFLSRLEDEAEAEGHDEYKDKGEGRMNWKVLDLLDLGSISSVGETEFDLIIDKSTSDAISCGPDLPRTAAYSISTSTSAPIPNRSNPDLNPNPTSKSNLLHPLNVLATNLARLITPGGRWLAISYSSDRFPFFSSAPSSLNPMEAEGGQYWTLEKKGEIQVDTDTDIDTEAPPGIEEGGRTVFRPKEVNYLYILVRTDVPVPTV